MVNNNGVILVQAGTRLSDSLIERLHGLGISFVVVAGPEAVARSKAPAERLADLERRFTGHETDPLMTRLKQIVSARISESAQE